MKAEEKIVAFMSFQLSCSLYIHWKKKQNLGVGEGVEKDKTGGTGGPNSSGR